MDAVITADAPTATPTVCPPLDRRTRLARFLSAWWLRPENALWMCLRSEVLATQPWSAPRADICCGDGVFSFLHAGGQFDPSFDVFHTVAHLDEVHGTHADIFDHFAADYRAPVAATPQFRIDVGTDHKPALLAKAACLGLYIRLLEHDAEQPLDLPSGRLQTVYCNSAYWVRNVDGLLSELRRICAPGGRVILHVKFDTLLDCTLSRHAAMLGERFLDIIGRGRAACWPTVTDQATWEERFARAGLDIIAAAPLATRTHAHLWDIGLRPVAPLLIRMANALTPAARTAIKRDWVALLCDLLLPLADPQLDLLPGAAGIVEMQYALTPRSS